MIPKITHNAAVRRAAFLWLLHTAMLVPQSVGIGARGFVVVCETAYTSTSDVVYSLW